MRIPLVLKALLISRRFPGVAVSRSEMLFISNEIISSRIPGCIVECGCFRGGSTSMLSLACERTGRKLHVFDSFSGLPAPSNGDSVHHVPADYELQTYEKGAFSAPLETVKGNVSKFGAVDTCTFWPGYFESTLPSFQERVALVFCDADLVESVKTCLRYLWPLMPDGAAFFTHEAHHLEIAKLFHDDNWWTQNLGQSSPGLIGAGSGLGLNLRRNKHGYHSSCLGFSIKNAPISRVTVENA